MLAMQEFGQQFMGGTKGHKLVLILILAAQMLLKMWRLRGLSPSRFSPLHGIDEKDKDEAEEVGKEVEDGEII